MTNTKRLTKCIAEQIGSGNTSATATPSGVASGPQSISPGFQSPKTTETCDFSEFTEINDDAAAVLARQPGPLYLGGLKALSDESARALGEHTGRLLDLDGLVALSDAAAMALARHPGKLFLQNIGTLSD